MLATQPARVSATVELDVPRGRSTDLDAGVVTVLEKVATVESVQSVAVTSLRPMLTDLRVTVDVELTVVDTAHDPASVSAALQDGFGVRDVTVHAVTGPGEDPPRIES